jgi:hypothetical protein
MAKETKPREKKITTAKTTGATKTVTKLRTEVVPTEQQIRERAFLIYKARNGGPGDPHADWVRAERELRAEMSR